MQITDSLRIVHVRTKSPRGHVINNKVIYKHIILFDHTCQVQIWLYTTSTLLRSTRARAAAHMSM